MVELFKRPPSKLDAPIDALLVELGTYDPESTEYQTALDALERLYKLRAEERRFKFSWDTVISSATTLCGIGMIIVYEQRHVMTTKAMTLVVKPKLP